MPESTEQNNKRIAKNTVALYIRTFITMLVGLYMSRVMLQALGVEDYGIHSVVGGIVSMSSLITGAMSQGIARFITYSLGKGDEQNLRTMFSTSINAQIIMSLIVTVVLEIVGVWFLNTQANIPEGRMYAANWVLQCSIVALAISLISSPFNALIIAHEKMAIYAYVSIAEAFLKLGICFAIMFTGGDRLIVFAFLQIVVALLLRFFYGWYCSKTFAEAHYSIKVFDKRFMKELTTFSGWTLLNHGAWVFSTQGVNMLVNMFFGVAFNASRTLASTVNHAAQNFVQNFSTAFNPQITKNYAAGNTEYAVSLTNRGTKFTWLMMYLFVVPICVEADTLLEIWLGVVPPMAALFLQLSMFESLAVSSGSTLLKLIQADGRMKRYSIETFIYVGLIFPLTWLFYELGAPIWISYVLFIFIFFTLNIIRFVNIKRLMEFSVRKHLREVVLPCIIVSITSFIVPLILCHYIERGVLRFFINVPVSVLWTAICCVLLGLNKSERLFFWDKAKGIVVKIRSKRQKHD